MPLFVSYYTPTYAAEAAGLVESLDRFGLPHDVVAVRSVGTWEANCSRKAAFLLDRRAEHPGRPLVWLDADSRVERVPALLTGRLAFDFAAHWFRGGELISACLYFAATPAADALMAAWAKGCDLSPLEWDQRTLQRIVDRDPPNGLRVLRLPPVYNWIQAEEAGEPDLSERFYGKRKPVIVQRQASRRLKFVEQPS